MPGPPRGPLFRAGLLRVQYGVPLQYGLNIAYIAGIMPVELFGTAWNPLYYCSTSIGTMSNCPIVPKVSGTVPVGRCSFRKQKSA